MDIQETIEKRIHPLMDDFFIEEVILNRQTDYWLGRIGSEERTCLADNWLQAVEMAEEMITCGSGLH